jgi:DNA-binding beta-propeller fold protein YncE
LSSPDATTVIGRYGQGSDINRINDVSSIIAPVSAPSILFMADTNNHRILLWDADDNSAIVIAGISGSFGSDSTRLYLPVGIILDETRDLFYVADRSNNRIQKYSIIDRGPGVTVAGWGQLNGPFAILLDSSGVNMFISDTLNHRVLLWLNGASQGSIIAGNGTPGNSTIQLNSPAQIRFDSNYNLYVADNQNNRIQRFDLISNGC